MSRITPDLEAALTQAMDLARQGHGTVTAAFIQDLRRRFDVNASPEVVARVMLAEGIMHAYEGRPPEARDRVRRALALCEAVRMVEIASEAHAWLAYLDYDDRRVGEFAAHAFQALADSDRSSNHARTRAASVVGTAYELSGKRTLANAWFGFARDWAVRDADALMMSTIIFNMAATRFCVARVASVCDGRSDALDATDIIFLSSSSSYDSAKRLSVNGHYHLMLRGMALSAGRDFGGALDRFNEYFAISGRRDRRPDVSVLAETAWCHLQLQDRSAAVDSLEAAAQQSFDGIDLDEAAIAHKRLSEGYLAVQLIAESEEHAVLGAEAVRGFRDYQSNLRETLAKYPSLPPATHESAPSDLT